MCIRDSRYNALKNPYVEIVAAFDRDLQVIGQKICGIEVLPFDQAPEIIRKHNIKVALDVYKRQMPRSI